MSVNTKIYLPAHAQPLKVFEVLQKITGTQVEQKVHSQTRYHSRSMKSTEYFPAFDGTEPASLKNPWYIHFKENPKNVLETTEPRYCTFFFEDLAQNSYRFMILLDYEEEEHALYGGKILNPNCEAVSCALGKRLVDFFGGKMMYCDSSPEDEAQNWYHATDVKFPTKTKEQSTSERRYQYLNALFNEPVLKTHELQAMKEVSYWSERSEKLFDYLHKYESYLQLQGSLDLSGENLQSKRPVKKI